MPTRARALPAFITFFLAALLFLPSCRAQAMPAHTFNWTFASHGVGTTVETCDMVQISLIAGINGSVGVAPYSILAFEVGGIPTNYTVPGNDPTNLTWPVAHAGNTKLMMTVQDSLGNIGGFSQNYIQVLPSSDTSCLAPPPPNPPMLSANISDAPIQTCQQWGMFVSGGTPPYEVFIPALNSPVFTPVNSTHLDDARFTYINRAPPGVDMMVSVQDSKGVWGYSTLAVHTQGSTDTTCTGLVTSFENNATFAIEQAAEASAAAAAAQTAKTQQITTALGAVFGVLGAALLAFGAWYAWHRRRIARERMAERTPSIDPEKPWDAAPPATPFPLDAAPQFLTRPSDTSLRTVGSGTPLVDNSSTNDLGRAATMPAAAARARVVPVRRTASFAIGADGAPLPGTPGSNSTSPRPSRKALEAAAERRAARDRSPPAPPLTADSTLPGRMRRAPSAATSAASSGRAGPSGWAEDVDEVEEGEFDVEEGEGSTIVYQHRDAGTPQVVLELPPAYMPRVDLPRVQIPQVEIAASSIAVSPTERVGHPAPSASV